MIKMLQMIQVTVAFFFSILANLKMKPIDPTLIKDILLAPFSQNLQITFLALARLLNQKKIGMITWINSNKSCKGISISTLLFEHSLEIAGRPPPKV